MQAVTPTLLPHAERKVAAIWARSRARAVGTLPDGAMLQALVRDEEFLRGDYTIKWLEQWLEQQRQAAE